MSLLLGVCAGEYKCKMELLQIHMQFASACVYCEPVQLNVCGHMRGIYKLNDCWMVNREVFSGVCADLRTQGVGGMCCVGADWYVCVSDHVLIPLGQAGACVFPPTLQRRGRARLGDLKQVCNASASTSRNRDNDNSSDLEIAVRTRRDHVPSTKDAFHVSCSYPTKVGGMVP